MEYFLEKQSDGTFAIIEKSGKIVHANINPGILVHVKKDSFTEDELRKSMAFSAFINENVKEKINEHINNLQILPLHEAYNLLCDEVDVEKLAEKEYPSKGLDIELAMASGAYHPYEQREGFIKGYNLAKRSGMFGLSQIEDAVHKAARESIGDFHITAKDIIKHLIPSRHLQITFESENNQVTNIKFL